MTQLNYWFSGSEAENSTFVVFAENKKLAEKIIQNDYYKTYRYFCGKTFYAQKRVIQAKVKKKRDSGNFYQAGNDSCAQKSACFPKN